MTGEFTESLESNVIVWKRGTRWAVRPRVASSQGGEAPVARCVVEGWRVAGVARAQSSSLWLGRSGDRARAGSWVVARTVESWGTADGRRRKLVGGRLPDDRQVDRGIPPVRRWCGRRRGKAWWGVGGGVGRVAWGWGGAARPDGGDLWQLRVSFPAHP